MSAASGTVTRRTPAPSARRIGSSKISSGARIAPAPPQARAAATSSSNEPLPISTCSGATR